MQLEFPLPDLLEYYNCDVNMMRVICCTCNRYPEYEVLRTQLLLSNFQQVAVAAYWPTQDFVSCPGLCHAAMKKNDAYNLLIIIHPWVNEWLWVNDSSKRGVGLVLSVLIFHWKAHPSNT